MHLNSQEIKVLLELMDKGIITRETSNEELEKLVKETFEKQKGGHKNDDEENVR